MNYYNFLNESFDKVLNEAKQDEINFANVFGQEMLNRFKAQKQRMHSPENGFYYWIGKARDNLDGTIEELDNFISSNNPGIIGWVFDFEFFFFVWKSVNFIFKLLFFLIK